MRANTALALAWLLVSAGAAQAETDSIAIVVNTTKGAITHVAPVLGKAPISVERAMQAAGLPYTATWFPNIPGYAAMIIEDEPATTSGGFGTPFWWLCVNGYDSASGMQTLVKAGDALEWSLVTDGKCPKS